MILAKEDIEKAVSWWAGKLIDNKPHSNGDDSFPQEKVTAEEQASYIIYYT